MRRVLAPLLLLIASPALAAWNPPGWERPGKPEANRPTGPAEVAGGWLLGVYRSEVSPLDHGRCPSYPTCSTYALQAVRLHGPLTGALLTAARLVSESDEAAFAPRVFVDGEYRVWYPVEDPPILRSP